jgi:hypothetical protein
MRPLLKLAPDLGKHGSSRATRAMMRSSPCAIASNRHAAALGFQPDSESTARSDIFRAHSTRASEKPDQLLAIIAASASTILFAVPPPSLWAGHPRPPFVMR